MYLKNKNKFLRLKNKNSFKLCIIFPFLLFLCYSCNNPEWVGRYKSTNCLTLAYIEFYQDKTVDVRYNGSKFAANYKFSRKENLFYVNMYTFEYREDEKMYEIGGYEPGCILEKDKSHGFWDKIFQP